MAVAWAYLQYLVCEHPVHHAEGDLRADSCGECPSCKKMAQLVHPDLHLVFPNSYAAAFRNYLASVDGKATLEGWQQEMGGERKMLMIKDADAEWLVQRVSMKPYEGGWKMALIWLPELMNATAANALLKTLEEPDGKTLMLLVSEDDSKILPTIKSRVQYVKLQYVEEKLATETEQQYAAQAVGWLRMLFKLKMNELSKKVDELAAPSRDEQIRFLRYMQSLTRGCFLQNLAGIPYQIGSGDEKIDASFPAMITARNVERIEQALDEAAMAIGRNANGKITFMQLSFNLSKALKNR